MNGRIASWEQFKTIIWLRWKLLHNQLSKSGKFNFAITLILIWSVVVVSALSLFITLGLGILFLRHAEPFYAMIIWDILIGVFLLMWLIGLMTELQRSEFLSLEKMLQLPMSLKSAFTLNYLTSLCSLATIFFVPTAIGLSLAFAVVHGPALLLLLPLVASLVWMVTAVTHQFRGWIASMMVNERWRRRIVVGMTLIFVAMSQLPNLAFQYANSNDPLKAQRTEKAELIKEAQAAEMSEEDRKLRLEEIETRFKAKFEQIRADKAKARREFLELANTVIPFGWPALCCSQLMAPKFGMSFIATFSMLAIGMLSFSRSYITTLRIYTRDDRKKPKTEAKVAKPEAATIGRPKSNWLERSLPWLPEHVSTVAIASVVNLIRAPESKMALIGPLSMFGVLGAILLGKRQTTNIPAGVEGFLLLGSTGVILFFITIVSLNTFGMDRSSFRALVMMPVRRQDILAGKNVALLPVFAVMAIPVAALVNFLAPASILCNIATVLQSAAILLGIAIVGNLMSIYFPIATASGTTKPLQMNFKTVGMQMLATFSFPLMMIPGFIALGIELALNTFWEIRYLPLYLGVSVIQLIIVQYLYRREIVRQGKILQSRETKIMEALASNAE